MFGVKAGVNMANLTGEGTEKSDLSMRMGFGGGVFVNYAFTELFAVQVEALYMMKGATYEFEGKSYDIAKFDYIELPLLLKVTIPTEGKIKPAIFAGPTFGFLMSAKALGDEMVEEDVKDQMNSMDIGILGGAEIGYQLEKGMIFLGASYEVGLQNLAKEEVPADEEMKNTNIGITLGYGFPF